MASEIMVLFGILLSFHMFVPYSVPQYVISGLIMFVFAEVLEGKIDHPSADSWKPNQDFKSQKPEVRLACDQGYTIASIPFASYGTPEGVCGAFSHGSCHANVLSTVEQVIEVFHFCICTVKSAWELSLKHSFHLYKQISNF